MLELYVQLFQRNEWERKYGFYGALLCMAHPFVCCYIYRMIRTRLKLLLKLLETCVFTKIIWLIRQRSACKRYSVTSKNGSNRIALPVFMKINRCAFTKSINWDKYKLSTFQTSLHIFEFWLVQKQWCDANRCDMLLDDYLLFLL